MVMECEDLMADDGGGNGDGGFSGKPDSDDNSVMVLK